MIPTLGSAMVLLALAVRVEASVAQQDDTLSSLRAAMRQHPDSFDVVFALGKALARGSTELEKMFRDRVEARDLLDRAVRLRPNDPRPMLEFGLLLRKQHIHVDAVRVLRRAEELALRADSSLTSNERADLHEQMALIYEVWWEDWATVGFLPTLFLQGQISCSYVDPGDWLGTLIKVNFECPWVFDDAMKLWKPLENMRGEERDEMLRHFRMAAELDPPRVEPALRLMRHLADAGRWNEYLQAAERLATARPDEARVWLFAGLGYHATGQVHRADTALAQTLERADHDLRRTLLNVMPLLRRKDSVKVMTLSAGHRETMDWVYWSARDPLYLTAVNERVLEHFARVAYADLAFTSPTSGLPGRWSDRGSIWIRYGRPDQIRTLNPHDRAGRVIFWDYGLGQPDYVFNRQLTYRAAWHEENSANYAETQRQALPESYRSEYPRIVGGMVAQMARFRSDQGDSTRLEVYARLPLDSLRYDGGEPLDAGLFAFAAETWSPVWSSRARVETRNRSSVVLQRTALLGPGTFGVSMEAMTGGLASKVRDTIMALPPGNALVLSDLLIADRVRVREDERPRRRTDLNIDVSPSMTFRLGYPIAVAWEIYGVQVDSATGLGSYRVQVQVQDARNRSALVRVLSGLVGSGGPRERLLLEWDTQTTDGSATVEFGSFLLRDAPVGDYRMTVTVTDRVSGASASTARIVHLVR